MSMKRILIAISLSCCLGVSTAAEIGGVSVKDQIKLESGQDLVLNGMGLREKFWVDVYVASLYLPTQADNLAAIQSNPGPWRLQLDIVYKEVTRKKLLKAWKQGFEKNQNAATLAALAPRIEQFYGYFKANAVAKDQYIFDYTPGEGVTTSYNGVSLGVIKGEDFKNALLAIWLGEHPASKPLRKGLLGQ